MQRHAETPKGAAFDLCQGAIRMHHRAGIDHNRELLDGHRTTAAIDLDARDARDPGRHVAFLAKCGGDAEPCILRHGGAPPRFLRRALQHRRLALRSADGVRYRAGIAPRAIEQGNTKGGWINPPRMGGLIHEALDCPIGPAGCNRA